MFHLLNALHSDMVDLTIAAGLVVGYHLYLFERVRRDRTYTIQTVNAMARASWVETMMANGPDVLPVQTLRNSTMAATFLASTAIVLIVGVLNLSGQTDRLSGLLRLSSNADGGDALWNVKVICLLVDFFCAFFCFSLAVRMYNHVGFLVNTPNLSSRYANTPAYVARMLNRGGWYYSTGMRSFYMSVPLVFWLFGPQLMLIAAMGLIVVLYHVDRAPRADYEPFCRPAPVHNIASNANSRPDQAAGEVHGSAVPSEH